MGSVPTFPPGSPRVGPLVLRSIPKGTSPGRQERRRAPRTCCQDQFAAVTGNGKHPHLVPQSTPLGRPRRGRPGQALSKPGASRSCWSCASPQTQLRSGHPSYRRRHPDSTRGPEDGCGAGSAVEDGVLLQASAWVGTLHQLYGGRFLCPRLGVGMPLGRDAPPERPWCAPARRGLFFFQQHSATGSMKAGRGGIAGWLGGAHARCAKD